MIKCLFEQVCSDIKTDEIKTIKDSNNGKNDGQNLVSDTCNPHSWMRIIRETMKMKREEIGSSVDADLFLKMNHIAEQNVYGHKQTTRMLFRRK
jgi:hypothetical protein